MVRINGLFHLLINGVYWGSNSLTNPLLTSWDIQAVETHLGDPPSNPNEKKSATGSCVAWKGGGFGIKDTIWKTNTKTEDTLMYLYMCVLISLSTNVFTVHVYILLADYVCIETGEFPLQSCVGDCRFRRIILKSLDANNMFILIVVIISSSRVACSCHSHHQQHLSK